MTLSENRCVKQQESLQYGDRAKSVTSEALRKLYVKCIPVHVTQHSHTHLNDAIMLLDLSSRELAAAQTAAPNGFQVCPLSPLHWYSPHKQSHA